VKEEPFRYGENNRGLGILTLPEVTEGAPVVVALNAGLLHRTEPYRLNVLICRKLALAGYICLRVDLSGKGDTPAREGLSNRESVALDWSFIRQALEKRFGKRSILILGLCSGADNGIKICSQDSTIKGLLLLDAVSPRDADAIKRGLINKLTNVSKLVNIPRAILNRFLNKFGPEHIRKPEPLMLRDLPTEAELQQCFTNIVDRQGRVLAIFTGHAIEQYNQKGQFSRALNVAGLRPLCEEEFWPSMKHLYPVQVHRDIVIQRIYQWGKDHFTHFQGLQ
jgi:hypothetical protein